jgi:ribonucleoside-diphosphate reductase alpha chain
MNLEQLKQAGEAPDFLNDEGLRTLQGGYLLPGETPRDMYVRVSGAAGSYYTSNPAQWARKFFDAMWKGWLCPASPVLSNMGTDRGLPISCNSISVDDNLNSIFEKCTELAMLTKNGAGVGIYLGRIRGRGIAIKGNGKSEGVVPWSKIYDTTIASCNQGSTRRGAAALYLPVDHPDIEEFLNIRRPVGDINRRCLNINHGVCISDDWMTSMLAGDEKKRDLWKEILRARAETGEPYLFFTDTVNNSNPQCYMDRGLTVETSNICNEIALHTDPQHSFVCCLSSLNLVKWDE